MKGIAPVSSHDLGIDDSLCNEPTQRIAEATAVITVVDLYFIEKWCKRNERDR